LLDKSSLEVVIWDSSNLILKFVRPFVSDFGETGVSFVGGKYPMIDHSLPRIEFGHAIGARRLQIAMVTDWTKPECRKTYQLLHDL